MKSSASISAPILRPALLTAAALCTTLCAMMLAVPAPAAAAAASPASESSASGTAAALLIQQEDTVPADTTEEESYDDPLPLQATRNLNLSTDEGTWISVDVSPDGGTVVFDLLGDLYTVPIEGGTARRITSGLAFDAQPRFSPDGERVLFVSDRSGGENLWTLELATGDTLQITEGKGNQYMSPDWTPDGEYVVASKGETRLGAVKLWLGHVEGGSGRILTPEPENLKTVGGAVTPDGRYVWHARRMDSWDYNAALPQYQLAVYDRETGESYTRTSRYGSAFRPTISPDGRWLVYGTRHEDQTALRIRDLETGDERWLAYPVQRDDQESIADRDVLPGMDFTPDSRELVVSYGGGIWRVSVEAEEPTPVPFQVNEQVALGPELDFDYLVEDSPTFTVKQIRDAVPSPDGSRLAFTALDRLYVMDWPNGQPQRLTDGSVTEAHPAWSPDGQWIAFVTWGTGGGHIMRVRSNARGASANRLTETPASWQEVAWSPDGDRLVAIRGPARAFREATGAGAFGAAEDLVWIPSNGGEATLIAPADGRSAPHFTEDPDRIFLSHGQRGLVSIRWDGTDEREQVQVVGNTRPGADEPNRASVIRMAPTGNRALALVNNDVYTVTVPYVGGETPSISVANPENAAFPVRRLTDIGGQFPTWGSDGETVHWSIGNAHLVYDLERARAVEDSVAAAERAAEADMVGVEAEDEEDDEEEADAYEPEERRIVINAQRDIPEGSVVLRGARAITMQGDEVIENADIVITNNRIAAVGAQGEVSVPEGAEIVDVSGQTVVPGFVDTHAHLRPAFGVHKTQAWQYLANLAYGVTTTRDPQTGSTDVLTYEDLVNAGEMLGPRIYSTGPGVFGDYVVEPIEDLDHARDVLRRYSDYYDTKTIKMYMAGNRQQRQWIAMASAEQRLMPTTEGGLMMGYDLTLGLDGYAGLEHSLPIYPIYRDVIELMAESGMAYTPTLLVTYGGPWAENYWYARENPHDDPKLAHFTPHSVLDQSTRRRNAGWFMEEEYAFPELAEGVEQIMEAGGRVGVGSHGQLQGLGYHWELWSMAAGGMSEHDALRAATLMGADAIGLDNDLGSIEAGKLADLVLLEENPLENLRNTNTIRYVMKNGRLYEGDTLNEIWPRERELERGDWVAEEPPVTAGMEAAVGG